MAGPAAATDCITSYRRLLLTMSLAAAAALVVRGVPTEHRPSKTSIATVVVVVIQWKLSTAVAMSMTITRLTSTMSAGHSSIKYLLPRYTPPPQPAGRGVVV